MELQAIRRADCVAVITPDFRNPLVRGGIPAERLVDLPNHTHIAPPTLDRMTARRVLRWPTDRPIVLHAGNMGSKQDLPALVRVAGDSLTGDDSGPLLLLMGDGTERAAVVAAASHLNNVAVCDPVEDNLYPSALAAADVLIVNERPTVRDMSLPSKLTSYFAAGRPVIARVPAGGATAKEVHHSGAGMVIGWDRDELREAIEYLLNSPEDAARLGARGRHYSASALAPEAAEARLLRLVVALRDTVRR